MKSIIMSCKMVVFVILIVGMCNKLEGQEYFSWERNTGNNATIAVLLDTDISINGEPIQAGDEIGVFTPAGLCVGGIVWSGTKNHAITVWQDNQMTDEVDGIQVGEVMHFRIWRKETNTEYSAGTVSYSRGDSIYVTNGIYVLQSLIVDDESPVSPVNSIVMYFEPGWNMISSYIAPENRDMNVILEDIAGNYVLIKNGSGMVNWPEAGIYELDEWEIEQGYEIYMRKHDTLVVTGKKITAADTPLELQQGWNLISYLLDIPVPVAEALASISGSIELVKTIDGRLYWPEEGIATIENMDPGSGYYIYVNAPATLYYPEEINGFDDQISSTNPFSLSGRMQTNFPQPRVYIPPVRNTGSSAILLVKSEYIRDDSEIGVWDERDQLIGSGVVKNGRAVIAAWGNNEITGTVIDGALEEELLSLTLWSSRDEKEYRLPIGEVMDYLNKKTLDEQVIYRTNSVLILTAEKPISDFPANYGLLQNFPNPFNPSTLIRYTLPGSEPVKLEVFDMLGKRIDVLVDDEQSAGYHEVVFHRTDLASGVYMYRLTAGYYTETRRMMLVR